MKCLAVVSCLAVSAALPILAAGPAERGVPPDVRALAHGNNAFALDLYGRLRQKEGNLFFSPYSISTALAMTSAGARGETAEQMAQVLHLALDPGRLHPAFGELVRGLNGHGLPRDYQLHLAQSLWGDSSLPVSPRFDDLIHTHYGTRLRRTDFSHRPEDARRQINRWVEQRTNDKIKELLGARDLDALTRMVLVNAIYFKAAWQTQFEESATRKGAVFHAAGKQVTAAMMRQTEESKYAEGEGFQALELPYEGGELSMLVLLPREKDGLGKLEQSLTAAKLDGCLGKLAARRVEVELPRFRLEARSDLGEELKALGMPLAFTSGAADFSGISTAANLYISRVIHQAFVDVNEEGTEAAAATAVVLALPGPVPPPPVVFRADHPFLFLIRDQRTGSILFLGRVIDPSR